MFGMGFGEILIIAIVAVIFLGPEKLPDAMVKAAKFFKTVKNSVNDVKSSFEQEMKIQELKDEALSYKKKLEEASESARKVITFDELEEIKKSTQSVSDSFKELENNVKDSVTITEAEHVQSTPSATTAAVTPEPIKVSEPKKEDNV